MLGSAHGERRAGDPQFTQRSCPPLWPAHKGNPHFFLDFLVSVAATLPGLSWALSWDCSALTAPGPLCSVSQSRTWRSSKGTVSQN